MTLFKLGVLSFLILFGASACTTKSKSTVKGAAVKSPNSGQTNANSSGASGSEGTSGSTGNSASAGNSGSSTSTGAGSSSQFQASQFPTRYRAIDLTRLWGNGGPQDPNTRLFALSINDQKDILVQKFIKRADGSFPPAAILSWNEFSGFGNILSSYVTSLAGTMPKINNSGSVILKETLAVSQSRVDLFPGGTYAPSRLNNQNIALVASHALGGNGSDEFFPYFIDENRLETNYPYRGGAYHFDMNNNSDELIGVPGGGFENINMAIYNLRSHQKQDLPRFSCDIASNPDRRSSDRDFHLNDLGQIAVFCRENTNEISLMFYDANRGFRRVPMSYPELRASFILITQFTNSNAVIWIQHDPAALTMPATTFVYTDGLGGRRLSDLIVNSSSVDVRFLNIRGVTRDGVMLATTMNEIGNFQANILLVPQE